MTRDDLKRFRALDIHFSAIGLFQEENRPYFCTPVGAEYVGWIGCDGVHFVLLPGDERVFCVDPAMGEEGTYVLPVASDFREFLAFLLSCQDANPLSQICWLTREEFDQLAAEDAAGRAEEYQAKFFAQKDAALNAIQKEFNLTPIDPFAKVKLLQREFNPSVLNWSDEYYDTLGLENPRRPDEEIIYQAQTAATEVTFRRKSMLPQDPYILLSFVNTKLRDEYPGLDALCGGLDADKAELEEKLRGAGYAYDPDTNQFKPV